MGNLGSVRRALIKVGANPIIAGKPEELKATDRIILPGVGNFADGMKNLTEGGWVEGLREYLKSGRPLLGICLGMQLLTKSSSEGKELGLGWIEAHTVKFNVSNQLSVPHMGWNVVYPKEVEQGIFEVVGTGNV